jgi:hypothetical protein
MWPTEQVKELSGYFSPTLTHKFNSTIAINTMAAFKQIN